MIVEYEILTSNSQGERDLVKQVNALINTPVTQRDQFGNDIVLQVWKPIGGVSQAHNTFGDVYMQAMVLVDVRSRK